MQRSPGGIGGGIEACRRTCADGHARHRLRRGGHGHGVADGMATMSPGRRGGDGIRSGPDFLTPLTTTEDPEAMAPAGMRVFVETIEDLKVLVATPP